MKGKIICMALVLLSLAFSFSVSFGAENVPESIRIGLAFNNPSIESINVSSNTGFEFGVVVDGEYRNICPYIDANDLKIEKASDINESAFLVQAGDVSEDLQGLTESFNMLEGLGGNFFAVYDNGWKMCIGPYSSWSEAELKAKAFSDSNDGVSFNACEYDSLILVESKDEIVFAYDCMKDEYLIKPIGGEGEEEVFSYNGHRYRGGVMVKRYSESDLTVINYLDMNEYLYGVLPWEMSNAWPLEALKAQAVAARNFAITNYGKYSHMGFNLCNTHNSQAYVGYDYEGDSCNRAVDETKGEILRWNGKIVSAFYHTNSGGYTENSENIWTMEVPYLRGVDDVFSVGGPHYSWELDCTGASVSQTLRGAGYNVGNSIDISIADKSENGHVLELLIESEKEDVKLFKNTMRTVFGYDRLRSTLFEIRKDNDIFCINSAIETERIPAKGISVLSGEGTVIKTDLDSCHMAGSTKRIMNTKTDGFVFEGKGWGHGLGMSQEGAKAMAEEGYDYREILSFYYKDTNID